MRATTGAAPVPVPPPAPAAMNTMSEPLSSALMRSYSSIAAARPRFGSEPAPSPRVMFGPMCSGDVGRRLLQRLQVGVDGHELDATDLGLDHAVDRVDAGTADADDAQHGLADRARLAPGAASRGRRSGRTGRRPAPGGARALHDVLGDVGREGVAQALLRRGHAGAIGLGRRADPPRATDAGSRSHADARAARARLRRAAGVAGAGTCCSRRGRLLLRAAPGRPPRSCGRGRPAGPPACSLAYRLPLARTSFARSR